MGILYNYNKIIKLGLYGGENMANTDAEYRKTRLEQNSDLDTLIKEETEYGDILKKQVYDVMEYIEKKAGEIES